MLGRYMAKLTSKRHPHRPTNMQLALVILAPPYARGTGSESRRRRRTPDPHPEPTDAGGHCIYIQYLTLPDTQRQSNRSAGAKNAAGRTAPSAASRGGRRRTGSVTEAAGTAEQMVKCALVIMHEGQCVKLSAPGAPLRLVTPTAKPDGLPAYKYGKQGLS